MSSSTSSEAEAEAEAEEDATPARAAARGRSPLRWAYVLVALTVPAAKLAALLLTSPEGRAHVFTADDAFYYFEIAARWAAGEGSTFDGSTPTNGYQPLWAWLLTSLFTVARSQLAQEVAVVGVAGLLWAVTVHLVWRSARVVATPTAGLAGLAGLTVVGYDMWFSGVEYPATVTVLLAVCVLVLERRLLVAPAGVGSCLGLGALLGLLALCRLDAAAVTAALAGVLAWSWRRAPGALAAARLAAVVGVPAATLTLYALSQRVAFGTWVPVSGLAKQLGDRPGNPSVVVGFLTYGDYVGVPLLLGTTSLVVAGAAAWATRGTTVARALLALVAAQVVQLGYYALSSSWRMEAWYYYLPPAMLVLGASVLVVALPARVARAMSPVLVVAVVVVVIGFAVRVVGGALDVPTPAASTTSATVAAARWVDGHLPADARLAMGDWAGAFTYSTTRPVTQTEGLVSDTAYLAALTSGGVGRYLDERRVGWFVKVGHDQAAERSAGAGCVVVDEPTYGTGPRARVRLCDRDLVYDQRGPSTSTVRIWRFDPARQVS